jgi:hypothetical protein
MGRWLPEWGRIGSPGKVTRRAFQTDELAPDALIKRIQAKTRRATGLNVLYIPFREAPHIQRSLSPKSSARRNSLVCKR